MAAAETACMNANRIRLKTLAEEENNKAAKRASKLLEKFDDDLIALLIGQNVISIASTAVATTLFISWANGNEALGSVLSTIIMTVFIYLIGETIPKNIANANADRYMMAIALPLDIFSKLLTPFIWVFSTLTALVRKKISGDNKEPTMTEEEFQTIVESISDEDILEPSEKRIIKSAVDFGETTVGEIMCPRENIFAIERSVPHEQIKEMLIDVSYSRIPVYDGTIDNVIGILRSKQILESLISGSKRITDFQLYPVLTTKPSVKLDALFEEMARKRTHMAIVRRKHKTVGLVTLEDMLEELVGEIYDDDEDIDQELLEQQIAEEDMPEVEESPSEEEEVSV
jgi:CBS domain containing-hemolysin-like protein